MSLAYYKNKNGTTYVYDSVSYWDKDKQQSRSKRTCMLVTFRIVSELTARVVAELLIQLSSVSDGFRMAYRHPLPSF